jgi:hypothetical protein
MKIRRHKAVRGFSGDISTGVPQFQEWLIESTLARREQEATVMLEKLETLQETLCIWSRDPNLSNKLLASDRIRIENAAAVEFSFLTQVCHLISLYMTSYSRA